MRGRPVRRLPVRHTPPSAGAHRATPHLRAEHDAPTAQQSTPHTRRAPRRDLAEPPTSSPHTCTTPPRRLAVLAVLRTISPAAPAIGLSVRGAWPCSRCFAPSRRRRPLTDPASDPTSSTRRRDFRPPRTRKRPQPRQPPGPPRSSPSIALRFRQRLADTSSANPVWLPRRSWPAGRPGSNTPPLGPAAATRLTPPSQLSIATPHPNSLPFPSPDPKPSPPPHWHQFHPHRPSFLPAHPHHQMLPPPRQASGTLAQGCARLVSAALRAPETPVAGGRPIPRLVRWSRC